MKKYLNRFKWWVADHFWEPQEHYVRMYWEGNHTENVISKSLTYRNTSWKNVEVTLGRSSGIILRPDDGITVNLERRVNFDLAVDAFDLMRVNQDALEGMVASVEAQFFNIPELERDYDYEEDEACESE